MSDLVYRAQHAEKTAAARQRRRLVCRNCGRLFTRHADWHGTRTCGKACEQELRRRNALASQPTLRPEVRAKVREAARRRSSDPDGVVERLRALEPDALGALAEREREILSLYYGLGDEGPRSRSEIAARVGWSEWRVRQAISRALVGLLGPDAVGDRHWVSGACRACGRAFVGERGQAYCSPTCFAAARRVGLAAGPWRQPGFAARVAATKRARRAEDAGYRSIAARLEALEPAAFGALPERDRAMVRLYYGPGGRRGLHVRRARRPVRPPP